MSAIWKGDTTLAIYEFEHVYKMHLQTTNGSCKGMDNRNSHMHRIIQFIGIIAFGLNLIGCRPSVNGPGSGETSAITAEWVSHETGLKPFVQNMTGFVMGRRQINSGDFWFEYRTPCSAKEFFANMEAATATAGWKKIYEAEIVRHFIIRNTTIDPAGKTVPYRAAATLNSYLIISAVYNIYNDDVGMVTIKGQFVHLN